VRVSIVGVIGPYARLLIVLILVFQMSQPTLAAAQLFQNGDMETVAVGGKGLPGWTSYRWEGDGAVIHAEADAFAGRRAARIEGSNPGKIAIFQTLQLTACTYRLSAMVAGADLAKGSNGRAAALYVAQADGTNEMFAIFDGTTGWRQLSHSFKVPANQQVIIYFYNFGSGAFFVDDVRLEAQEPCASAASGFRVATNDVAPLTYKPPATPNVPSASGCGWAATRLPSLNAEKGRSLLPISRR
jgi:hypothetical protein